MMKNDAFAKAVRRLIAEALLENVTPVSPEYAKDLDAILQSLQATLKAVEAAHQKAPDPTSKVILTGVHSDLFNAAAEARGFIQKLKSGKPQG
jgi:hypothetical protein